MKLTILLRTQNSQNELWKFEGRAQLGDEIVVVDHASSDCTVEIAAKMGAKIVTYPRETFSYGAALNAGIPMCTNDWVLVASPHFEPLDAGFWDRLVRDLHDLPEDVMACQAPIFLTTRTSVSHSGLTFLGPNDLAAVPWALFGNTCCAYRREALERMRFDEVLLASEDIEWCLRAVRAGYQICINHRIPVLYRNRAPLARYWKKGRTDFLAVAQIYGVIHQVRPMRTISDLVREAVQFALGRFPFWLWIRLVVKRAAEFSLLLVPASKVGALGQESHPKPK